MLRTEKLSKKFYGFQLNNLTFELPAGYIMGLVGENGAGKTTLLKMLAGLYRADEGKVVLNDLEPELFEAEFKDQIGVVFHDDFFDRYLSLEKNAARYGKYYTNYSKELLITYAERFALNMKKKYKKLSKGEKLKFAFAFALAHRPKLLLLDEPTANFDKEFRQEFFKVLREFTESGENSIILSTHLTADIDKMADYLLFLQNGEALEYGTIEEIRNKYRIVAGEAYRIRLLKERIVRIEENEYGATALVTSSRESLDKALKAWEPSMEELMYHLIRKGGRR